MNDSNAVLDVKAAEVKEIPQSLADAYREKMGKLLDLTDDQEERIKKWLKEKLADWEADTADLHARLEDDNDLVEGIIMETDFPWVDCSNVHQPLTEIYMDGSCAIEERSILGAGFIWVCETDSDDLRGVTADIEEMMDWNARNKWNIESSVPGILWCTNRDGLGVVQVPYVEDYEKTNDILVIGSQEEFRQEFPTPEDAGIDEEEYNKLDELCAKATDQLPVEVPVTFEKPTYVGPKAEIVEAVDFVTIPAWVSDIRDPRCRGYGKRYKAHIETIREKRDNEIFYKEAADTVVKDSKASPLSSYLKSKDGILGIKRTSSKDERDLYELVVKGRLDDDGEIKKLLVTYQKESDQLLQCMEYIYRVDFYALFRVDERPNQLFGKSVPSKTRDLNDLADTLVNQTVNANTLSTVPIFKGKKDMKEELDPELQQNKIRPGMILWLADFDSFDQFRIQPTDHGENQVLVDRSMNVLDMYIGMPASLFSGGVPTGDATSPGNKTALLIQQGNLRMEHPISTFRRGMAELGDICLSHIYQFGPPVLEFQSETANPDGTVNRQAKTIYKKYLRKDIRLKMNGVSVVDNPESEMQKAFQLHQILMTTPTYAQAPDLQNELLRDALQKGRVRGRERYLPSMQVIQQKLAEMHQETVQGMAAQQQALAKKAQELEVNAKLQKAKRELSIKDTAQKVAESNLGITSRRAKK